MRIVRGIWKLLVGVKDLMVLIFMLIFFGALFFALSAAPNPASAGSGALVIDLDGSLVEQPSEPDALGTITGSNPTAREYRLRDVVRALDAAATDSAIKAVVLDLERFTGGGQATIAEAGRAIDRVRAANKPVLAYATGYLDDSYQLAAHASEVWIDPFGAVLIAGPGGARLYYKGLLDKLGVEARVYRVGTFKSAVEPFTLTGQSEPARRANQALADAVWGSWRAEVQQARPGAKLAAYVTAPDQALAAAGGDPARAARAAGMVDWIGDRVAFGQRVAALAGKPGDAGPGEYSAIPLDNWVAGHPAPKSGSPIGVLTVAGEIVDGDKGPGSAGGDTIADLLLEELSKNRIKALVVRVDSPGGSVTASERIRTAILAARAKGLPVVVSMGSVAASGGYWISTAGDRIFADPATITGSIGVFGILPTFRGTLEKLGLSADGVKTTPLSGEPDLYRGTSPEFDRLLQTGIEDIYRRFTGLVAQSRRMSPARVDQIGQGRVWAGSTARAIGLVDGFGGLDAAIAEAARRAKLDPAKVYALPIEEEPGWFGQIIANLLRDGTPTKAAAPADAWTAMIRRPEASIAGGLRELRAVADGPAIQVRCLECPIPAQAPPPRGDVSWLTLIARLIA